MNNKRLLTASQSTTTLKCSKLVVVNHLSTDAVTVGSLSSSFNSMIPCHSKNIAVACSLSAFALPM